MNNLTKLALVGAFAFSATMGLVAATNYGNKSQTAVSERAVYSTVAGAMAVAIFPLMNYKTEERREEHYEKL